MKLKNFYQKIKSPRTEIGRWTKISIKSVAHYFAIFLIIIAFNLAASLPASIWEYQTFKKTVEARPPQNYYYCHEEVWFGSTEPCTKEQLLETEKRNISFRISISSAIIIAPFFFFETSSEINNIPTWYFTLALYGIFLLILYRNYLIEYKTRDFKIIIWLKKYYKHTLIVLLIFAGAWNIFLVKSDKYSTPNADFDKYPGIEKIYKDFPEISNEFNDISDLAFPKNDRGKCKQLPEVGAYYGVNKELSDWGAYTHVYKLRDLCVNELKSLPYMNQENSFCDDSVCQLN